MADPDPSFDELRRAVCASIDELYERDRVLLGTTERAVVGRLMIYLDNHLGSLSYNGLVLDQEYERAGHATKELAGEDRTRKIVPDMIYHERLNLSRNVLAIEVKTVNAQSKRLHDFAKLSVLTGHADYAEAYSECLRLKGDPKPRGQDFIGPVGLPPGMEPYTYGLWLLIRRSGPQFTWWSNRRGPKLLPGDAQWPDVPHW